MERTVARSRTKTGLAFALRELALVLADWWQAGDLGGRLRAWWEVVTGKTPIE